jgi:hypothetical protein
MEHPVLADGDPAMSRIARERAALRKATAGAEQIDEPGAQLGEHVGSHALEEVPQARSGGRVIVTETEELAPVSPSPAGQELGEATPAQALLAPQAEGEEERYRMEGHLAFGTGLVDAGELALERGEVDEVERDLEVAEIRELDRGESGRLRRLVAGAIARLGRGRQRRI